jgi:hypothetical protein
MASEASQKIQHLLNLCFMPGNCQICVLKCNVSVTHQAQSGISIDSHAVNIKNDFFLTTAINLQVTANTAHTTNRLALVQTV